MKKLILLAGALICYQLASAKVTYTKERGGLFGYKYVTTTDYGNGDVDVLCTDPGVTRCKPSTAIMVGGGQELTPEGFEAIDNAVMAAITPNNPSGQILFNSTFFVNYSYDANTDRVVVNIYTIAEAQALGLIP